MRLIDISVDSGVRWSDHNMYYRVDDDQRTIMSGQDTDAGHVGAEITILSVSPTLSGDSVCGGS
jgi:hypothetical protein